MGYQLNREFLVKIARNNKLEGKSSYFLKDFQSGLGRRIFLSFCKDGGKYLIWMLIKIEKEAAVALSGLPSKKAPRGVWVIQESICSRLPESNFNLEACSKDSECKIAGFVRQMLIDH